MVVRQPRATLGDSFTARTQGVWDVDPVHEVIHVDRADQTNQPVTYRRGDVAEAEPAVPGRRVCVGWIFG